METPFSVATVQEMETHFSVAHSFVPAQEMETPFPVAPAQEMETHFSFAPEQQITAPSAHDMAVGPVPANFDALSSHSAHSVNFEAINFEPALAALAALDLAEVTSTTLHVKKRVREMNRKDTKRRIRKPPSSKSQI